MALSARKIAAKRGVSAAPSAGQGVPLGPRGNLSTDLIAPDVRYYATPVAPAPTPSDFNPAAALNAPYQNGGFNLELPDNSYSPLCWYFTPGGKKRIEGAVDGVPIGSVVVTLPQAFWPTGRDYVGPILSADGTTSMGVQISAANGQVTVLSPAAAATGASGVTAGTYGDSTHVAQTTVNAQGLVTSIANVSITGGSGPGTEIGYDQITGNVTVSSTTEASGTSVIAGSSHTFDGSPVIATFYCAGVDVAGSSGAEVVVNLFESSTQIGRLGLFQSAGAGGLITGATLTYRFTPSAGAHTYSVTAYEFGGAGVILAGSGGAGGYLPTYLRFTKV